MTQITCWQDIEDLGGAAWLTPAEKKLIDACRAGTQCILGVGPAAGKLPPAGAPDPDRRVRAELLRYLVLGGCEACPVRGWGVVLSGAHVENQLDLSFQTVKGATALFACHFTQPVVALQSQFEFLNLSGSHLPGLNAQGARTSGNVFVGNVTSTGTVTLSGATVGGQLNCSGARFETDNEWALDLQNAKVLGDVVLSNASAQGTVILSGAAVGGQLSYEGATFDTRAAGEENEPAGNTKNALNMQRLQVAQGLFWRDVTVVAGSVDLNSASVGDLVDDPDCWPERGRLILDGFTYDRIGGAPIETGPRLDWLEKGDTWDGQFFPHPYTQLATVLQKMGLDRDARRVLTRRERLLHADLRRRLRVQPNGDWDVALRSIGCDLARPFLWAWDLLLRAIVGYGYHPMNSVFSLLGLWLVAIWLSHMAWIAGDFAPNSGPVQISPEWQVIAVSADNPAELWSSGSQPGRDWETFNRYAYAADLIIPIITLGQTEAWAPSTTRGDWGRRLWRYGFLLQIAGWIVTALGAAAITGIIRRD